MKLHVKVNVSQMSDTMISNDNNKVSSERHVATRGGEYSKATVNFDLMKVEAKRRRSKIADSKCVFK